MDPITGAMLGSVAVNVIGGLLGAKSQKEGRDAAKKSLKDMKARIDAIPLPELKKLALENPKWLGDMFPLLSKEKFEALDLPEEITTDPRFRQAQLDTLDTLETVSKEGMTAEDKLNLENISQRSERDISSQRKATMQSMAERGMGGAGMELAQNLQAQQESAQRQGMEGLQLAADKRRTAMNAMMQRGNVATQMRGQEFGEAESNRQARMTREDFNKRLSSDTQQRNVFAENQARLRDLQGKQSLEGLRAENVNRERVQSREDTLLDHRLNMEKEALKQGISSQQMGIDREGAAAESQAWGSLAKAAGQGIGGWAQGEAARTAGDAAASEKKLDRESAEKIAKMKYGN
jgi:hypothetical protein